MRLGLGNTLAITNKVGDNPYVPPAYALGWLEPAVLVSSSTDNTIVSTEGVFKEARRYGSATSPTINGVTFTYSNYGTSYSENALFSAVGSSTAEMQSLLRNLSYDIPSNIVSLTGFTVGKTYMLQWFFADERLTPSDIQNRTQTITIAGYAKTFPAQLVGKAMKCYFVAPTPSLNLSVGAGEPESGHIEAFQIRQLD